MEENNGRISMELVECIREENLESSEPGERLKGVLKKILNSEIHILIEGKHVLTIVPYWCELYFKAGAGLDDPFCDERENKKHNDRVYFRHFFYKKDANSHRNRMDICLGDKDNQVSILLKRADVTPGKDFSKAKITNKTGDVCSSDSFIAEAVLTALGGGEDIDKGSPEFGKITYKLLSNTPHIGDDRIGFAKRIRLSDKKGKDWFDKKYAFFDKSKYTDKLNLKAESKRRQAFSEARVDLIAK